MDGKTTHIVGLCLTLQLLPMALVIWSHHCCGMLPQYPMMWLWCTDLLIQNKHFVRYCDFIPQPRVPQCGIIWKFNNHWNKTLMTIVVIRIWLIKIHQSSESWYAFYWLFKGWTNTIQSVNRRLGPQHRPRLPKQPGPSDSLDEAKTSSVWNSVLYISLLIGCP